MPRPDWEGRRALSRDGADVGTVERVHGDAGGWPELLVVRSGERLLALPAEGSLLSRESLHIPYSAARLASSHPLDEGAQDDAAAVGRAAAAFTAPETTPIADDPDAMILSEEQLAVRVEPVATHRVRLRKVLVEREVTVPVRVRHEEVEVVREPVDAVDAVGPDGAAASVEVRDGVAAEILLYAERPVVTTEVVPVERVRLVKSYVTEERVIEGEVRREEAAVDQLPPHPAA